MESIRSVLETKSFWDDTYNKMITKHYIKRDESDLLWKIKEIYRSQIIDDILCGEYEWSIPKKVKIAKANNKKKRVVYIYELKDRYILGVLYRAISYCYSDEISDLCFSYKKTVSTNDAILYLNKAKKENKNLKYGVKIDIHSYFNSVSEDRVKEMINKLFSGGLKLTFEKLMLNNKVEYKSNIINEWKSLIPGCAIGSFFANYCLKDLDDKFTDKTYARYSDDIIVLEETREELKRDLDIIKSYIKQFGLEINPDKYTWFEPGDNVEYLGLKILGNNKIDISDHAKQKIKKQIHRWCRKGRMEIERDGKPFNTVAKKIIRRINNKNMFCVIDNNTTFGWCHYSFRYINTIESLIEIDFYTKDTIRAMKTGKHNKANIKALTDNDLKKLGFVSLVDMYKLYKEDFDYYMEIVELMKNS